MWSPATFLLLANVLLIVAAENCPELYKRFSAEHTFCRPKNKQCVIRNRGVSEKDKEDIVRIHNELRNKIATGQERRAGGMPRAENMLEMVWDDELAAVAQKLAETCHYGHDCNDCRRVAAFSVGQNIGKVSSSGDLSDAGWNGFITRLYDEVAFFNKGLMNPYIPGPEGPKQYGHFSQVVWATSWRIGCGWALFDNGSGATSYTVCNYGPAGNMQGGEMYKAGPTCSACPENSCCGSSCKKHNIAPTYPGLCKVIDPSKPPEGFGPHGGDYILYCDFNKQDDCRAKVTGKKWKILKTPGGNWVTNVLKGGESTKLTFEKKFDVTRKFCVKLLIRNGPNIDGDSNDGKGISYLDYGSTPIQFKLEQMEKKFRQQFTPHTYGMQVSWPMSFQYSFEFSVPEGSPPQFVEIKEVSVKYC